MLRDIWCTAWLISGEEWLSESIAYVGRNGRTLLQQMQGLNEIEPRHHFETRRENGILRIVRMDNRTNGLDGCEWRCYINNRLVAASVDKQQTVLGDRIDYRFESAGTSGSR